MQSDQRSLGNVVLVFLFFSALWAPLFGLMLGIGQVTSADENRNLAKFPALTGDLKTWRNFPAGFNDYFRDHFGFRKLLVSLGAAAKLKLLGISSSPDVIVGKDHWLFYSGSIPMDNYAARVPFSEAELDAFVKLYRARRDWLRAQGIEFALVLVPDKPSVYPEDLPIRIVQAGSTSRMDQLVAHFRAKSDIRVIEIKPAILAGKAAGRPLYYQTDTHWNVEGAFIGYRQIMAALAPMFPRLKPISESQIESAPSGAIGDLTRLLGLASGSEVLYDIRFGPRVTMTPVNRDVAISQSGDTTLPKLVMFRDSFGKALGELMARHFSRGVYVWGHGGFDPPLIRTEKPNLVLVEIIERWLMSGVPVDPPYGPASPAPVVVADPSETNVALGKPAVQSSTREPIAVASHAVDGNTDGNFYSGSITHTNVDTNPWWEVDLGSPANIKTIRIWNRTDCCRERLRDYWVFVSNAPFGAGDSPASLQRRPGTWSNHQVIEPNPSTSIPLKGFHGRYVRVQMEGVTILSLAEVEVFVKVQAHGRAPRPR